MKGFKNAKIYVEGRGVITADLSVENGKIREIGENLKIDEPYEVKDGSTVTAGFIDEHIHGAAGADAMDGSVEALKTIANALAREGTTSFLATTMTQSPENVKNALSAVNRYIGARFDCGARVLGAHLEGPFISLKHVGAQPKEYVQAPSVEAFKVYENASGGNIRLVTLAAEEPGAEGLIKYLNEKGIVASVGHTNAGYADIEKAKRAGLKCVTHTFNAQTALHHREVGVVGSAMLFDELTAELICDTVHVSVPAIKLMIKNKPHDKLVLITDAMRAKGMPDGESELGGQVVIVKGGEARLADGTLAGSVLKMNDAVKNLITKCGASFTDAVDFATINPAKNLGVDGEYGSIAVGKAADFAVLSPEFEVELTVRDGNVVYKKR